MSSKFYQQTFSVVCSKLGVDPNAGLNNEEVSKRLEQYGQNEFKSQHKISPLKLFLSQFKDVLIIVLIFAALVSLVLGLLENGSIKESLLIFAIVIAISIVGFLNEYKAERTVEALRKLVAQKAQVRRGGSIREINSLQLVPGDIVIIGEGQKIPADIRLIKANTLEVNESSLTGESLAVTKHSRSISQTVTLGDQANMLFSGTFINTGTGEGIVVATGSNTQIGQIAHMVDATADDPTPMQKKLDHLGKQLGVGVLVISAIVFLAIFLADHDIQDITFWHRLIFAFTVAVALAVAAIPEGLAFVVRISLALGARRMAGRQALVRKLSAVEALGSTDTICADKTGTLTRGEMTVRAIWAANRLYRVEGSGYEPVGEFYAQDKLVKDLKPLLPILKAGLLCNDSHLVGQSVIGDPTEGALIISAVKAGLHHEEVLKAEARVSEVPFSSERKMMSTVHKTSSGYKVYSKGAAEVVLGKCTHILVDGQLKLLTDSLRQEVLKQNHALALKALRVLGFACKEAEGTLKNPKEIESKLIFLGLQGMMDPPRTEIKEVIQRVTKDSGMRVVMITGDHIETARAVAAEIGIVGEAMSGTDLDKLSQKQFEQKVEKVAIYARVNPEHKIRIVQALKKHGHQVAMTGDGVNDAPAIKAADIGIAMGITGSDVAKEASDLILLDDQFLTIIAAIEEGRGIFDNIRKFVNYLLSANIAEVLAVFFGVIFYKSLILTAAQLLFINIVTDGLPAVALGSDPAERGIMRYKPQRFQASIINKKLWLEMFIFGFLMSAVILSQFAYNLNTYGLVAAESAAFVGMVILEMVRLVNIRSDYKIKWRANPWLMVAIASSLAILLAVLYVPLFNNIFDITPVSIGDWLYISTSAIALFIIMHLVRGVLERIVKDPQPAASKVASL